MDCARAKSSQINGGSHSGLRGPTRDWAFYVFWRGEHLTWVFRFQASVVLFAFLAFLLVFQSAYAVLPVLAAIFALVCCVMCGVPHGLIRLAVDDLAMVLVLMLFALVWLADVWRAGQWPVGAGGEGRWLPVWPLLAALVRQVGSPAGPVGG